MKKMKNIQSKKKKIEKMKMILKIIKEKQKRINILAKKGIMMIQNK